MRVVLRVQGEAVNNNEDVIARLYTCFVFISKTFGDSNKRSRNWTIGHLYDFREKYTVDTRNCSFHRNTLKEYW